MTICLTLVTLGTKVRNIYIKMCLVLDEDQFLCMCFSTLNSSWGWGSWCLHELSLSNNYTVFVENQNLWRFDCMQWVIPITCQQFKQVLFQFNIIFVWTPYFYEWFIFMYHSSYRRTITDKVQVIKQQQQHNN